MTGKITFQAACGCEWCGDIEVIESSDIAVIESRLVAMHWHKDVAGLWFCSAVCDMKDRAAKEASE